MPTGELQNHNTWCFKKFPDFVDDIDHDHYFSPLNDVQYFLYNAVAVQVKSFQYNKQAVHMIRYVVCSSWRKH